MGNTPDKEQSAKSIGDQTVTIVENQEVHTAAHVEHSWKLNIILALLVVQLSITVIKYAMNLVKKTLARAATKAVLVQQV